MKHERNIATGATSIALSLQVKEPKDSGFSTLRSESGLFRNTKEYDQARRYLRRQAEQWARTAYPAAQLVVVASDGLPV